MQKKIIYKSEKYKHLVEHLYNCIHADVKEFADVIGCSKEEIEAQARGMYCMSIFYELKEMYPQQQIDFLLYFLHNFISPHTMDIEERAIMFYEISKLNTNLMISDLSTKNKKELMKYLAKVAEDNKMDIL
jgi:hypothetical protein